MKIVFKQPENDSYHSAIALEEFGILQCFLKQIVSKRDKTNITRITIEEGIISLGDYILSDLENVKDISISSMVGNSLPIATTAFAGTNNFNNITIAQVR